ncbi:MAG: hypothetical protein GX256_10295 [Fretibacterium sp.]|nr:hypothetical protein [Fretibacterium sp.]
MYVCLSWTGGLKLWDIGAALILSFFIALVAPGTRFNFGLTRGLSPFRWWLFLQGLFGPLAAGFLRSACETVWQMLRGDIRSSWIRVQPRLRDETARMLLAHALTLTTEALTVDVGEDGSFCLHLMTSSSENRVEAENQCAILSNWARRVAE